MPGATGKWTNPGQAGASGSWDVEDEQAVSDGWHPLSSSNLAAYAYDRQTETLRIRFKSGRTYEYSDVPASVASSLATAGSAGSYFNSAIKHAFSYTQM